MNPDNPLRPSSGLRVRGLALRLGDVQALRDVSVHVAPGQHVAVIGPSGAGKSSLLRVVAGFVVPQSGSVDWEGETWSDGRGVRVPPRQRRIGMVAQDPALWPHLSAAAHIVTALRLRGAPRAGRAAEAARLLALVALTSRATHRPSRLSGGEAQRLALARALAGGSRVLLLDEPLGQLDVELREELAAEIPRVAAATGAAILHVTHAPDDAFRGTDAVLVLESGRVTQTGAPGELIANPATPFVARVVERLTRRPASRRTDTPSRRDASEA